MPRLVDLSEEEQKQFNIGPGRYLSASLMLLNHALWTMPENELRPELERIYCEYRSILGGMGRLVPPMYKAKEDEICRVATALPSVQSSE
jgi:hypothetical protein